MLVWMHNSLNKLILSHQNKLQILSKLGYFWLKFCLYLSYIVNRKVSFPALPYPLDLYFCKKKILSLKIGVR